MPPLFKSPMMTIMFTSILTLLVKKHHDHHYILYGLIFQSTKPY